MPIKETFTPDLPSVTVSMADLGNEARGWIGPAAEAIAPDEAAKAAAVAAVFARKSRRFRPRGGVMRRSSVGGAKGERERPGQD